MALKEKNGEKGKKLSAVRKTYPCRNQQDDQSASDEDPAMNVYLPLEATQWNVKKRKIQSVERCPTKKDPQES